MIVFEKGLHKVLVSDDDMFWKLGSFLIDLSYLRKSIGGCEDMMKRTDLVDDVRTDWFEVEYSFQLDPPPPTFHR